MEAIYPNRVHHPLLSMTVSELILELQKHDPDLLVIATWEGTWNAVTPDNFKVGAGKLLIDVENH